MTAKNNNGGLNLVFKSVYKDEIEKRLAIGSSPRSISAWLKTRGEAISHTTITKYKNEYFDTSKMVASIVKEKQEETAEGLEVILEEPNSANIAPNQTTPNPVNQKIAQIRAVNHVQLLYESIQDMREYLGKLQNYEPVVAAHAAKGIYSEIRATIETLERLQNNSKEDDNSSVAKLLNKLKSHNRELEKDVKKRRESEENG